MHSLDLSSKKQALDKELHSKVLREFCAGARQRVWNVDPNFSFMVQGVETTKKQKISLNSSQSIKSNSNASNLNSISSNSNASNLNSISSDSNASNLNSISSDSNASNLIVINSIESISNTSIFNQAKSNAKDFINDIPFDFSNNQQISSAQSLRVDFLNVDLNNLIDNDEDTQFME